MNNSGIDESAAINHAFASSAQYSCLMLIKVVNIMNIINTSVYKYFYDNI